MQILIFYIPAGTSDEAKSLGQIAIEHQIAACANVFPSQSIFPWEGSIQNEQEFILILKTMPILKDKLMGLISQHHSYELPCILNWYADVNEKYGNWIKENVLEE